MKNLYPGAPFEREVLSLEIILSIIDGMNTTSPNEIQAIPNQYQNLLSYFYTKDTVITLLNLTMSR
jgi:hypothetical protein